MKNVIVTGVSGGLGYAIANSLIQKNYKVIGIGRNCPADLAKNDLFSFYKFDLSDIDKIKHLCREILLQHNEIYALVNNAAIGADGILGTMHETEIKNALNINLAAPIVISKYVGRAMLKFHSGRIINISSIIANTGYSGLSVYAACKSGLVGFSKSLARELGKRNITVNCISPGFMETEMTKAIDEEKFAKIRSRSPLGLPSTENVADSVIFLLSSAGEKITGTVITIDGGATA